MDKPYPQITFRVNTIRNSDINSWPAPDNNLNNILLNLKNVTVWVDYVPYALKYGDVFTLYGKEALHVYKQYVQINKPNLVLEVEYYGLPLIPTPIPTLLPTPTPSPSPSPTESPLPTPTNTLTPTPSPSPSVTISPTPPPTPSPTITLSPTPSPSPSVTISPTPTPSPSPSPSLTPSPTITLSPTPSPTPSFSPSPTPSPTLTLTPTPSPTPSTTISPTPEPTVSPTITPTETPIPTPTETPLPTITETPVPTITPTETPIPTPTETPLPSASTTPEPTASPTPSPTITLSPSPTPSPTPTSTPSPSPSFSPSPTPSPTPAPTPAPADPTLQIWYNASDTSKYQPNGNDGTSITQWNDSGTFNAHNAGPNGGPSARPTVRYNIQNGLAALEFDGGDGLGASNMNGLASISNASLIWVGKTTTPSSTQILTTAGTNSSTIDGMQLSTSSSVYVIKMAGGTGTSSVGTDTNFHVHTILFDGTQTGNANRLIYRVDGVQQTLNFGATTVGSTTNSGTTYMYFGADQALTRQFTGYAGEILIYTQTLNGSSLANTEKYLKDKWNIA